MQSRLHFRVSFGASHLSGSEWPSCGNSLHGHEWGIEADFLYDPLNDVSPWPEGAMIDIRQELEGRHLNDMIKPSHPDPYGLAHWVMARLASTHRVERVTVWQGMGVGASVEADEIRRR